MVKRELKEVWLLVVWKLTEIPQSINEISKKSGVSWESTKNCLEVLSFLQFIDIDLKNNKPKYMLKMRLKEKEAIELINRQKELFKEFNL